jgi:hypothetical protein
MKRATKSFIGIGLTLVLGAALLISWALWSRENATWELRHEAAGVKVWERFDAVAVEFTQDWDFTVSDGRPEEPVTWFMNTNFMDSLHQTMGLAVVDGKTLSKRTTGGGYFYVKGGKPRVARSCPSGAQFATQTHLHWRITDGRIQVTDHPTARVRRFRNLIGQKANGNIVFIASNAFGWFTAPHFLAISKELDIQNAAIFDGAASLHYGLELPGISRGLRAVPPWLGNPLDIPAPTVYVVVRPS